MKKKILITISLIAVILFTGCDNHNKIIIKDDLSGMNMSIKFKHNDFKTDKDGNYIENKSLVFSGPTRKDTNIENFKQTGFSEKE